MRNRYFRRPRPGGFMLVEMMSALTLLLSFGLVATHLLRLSLNISAEAARHDAATAGLDAAMRRLRSDVWQATSLRTPDAHTLIVDDGAEGVFAWHVEDAGTLLRTPGNGDAVARWAAEVRPDFHVQGAGVAIHIPGDRRDAGAELTFISQLLIAQSGVQ